MVDEEPVVEHLFVLAVVNTDHIGGASAPQKVYPKVEPAKTAAQTNLTEEGGGVPTQIEALMGDGRRRLVDLLDGGETQPSSVPHRCLHLGHHGQINVWGGAVPDNDRRFGVSLRHHGHMGKAHRAGGGTLNVDEERGRLSLRLAAGRRRPRRC